MRVLLLGLESAAPSLRGQAAKLAGPRRVHVIDGGGAPSPSQVRSADWILVADEDQRAKAVAASALPPYRVVAVGELVRTTAGDAGIQRMLDRLAKIGPREPRPSWLVRSVIRTVLPRLVQRVERVAVDDARRRVDDKARVREQARKEKGRTAPFAAVVQSDDKRQAKAARRAEAAAGTAKRAGRAPEAALPTRSGDDVSAQLAVPAVVRQKRAEEAVLRARRFTAQAVRWD